MEERLRTLIAEIAAGAAEGAAAMRRSGIELELDAYSVEARIDGTAATPPVASIRVDFVATAPPRP